MIGINTMIWNGVGLAVPANAVQQFLNGKNPFRLGVTVRPIVLPIRHARTHGIGAGTRRRGGASVASAG